MEQDQNKLNQAQQTQQNDQNKVNDTQGKIDQVNDKLSNTVHSEMPSAVKEYLGSDMTHCSVSDDEYLKQMDQFKAGMIDSIQHTKADDIKVDPTNLTKEQQQELNEFAASVVNDIRTQIGKSPVTPNWNMIDMANQITDAVDVSNYYDNHNFWHATQFINDAAKDHGLAYDTSGNMNMYEDMCGNTGNVGPNITMYDLKVQLVRQLMMFMNDKAHFDDVFYNEPQEGNYIPMGISWDQYGYLHYESVNNPIGNSYKDKSKFEGKDISLPNVSELQNQKSDLESQLAQQKQQVEQDKQVVQDLQNQIAKDKEQIKNDTPTALQNKLEQDQKKLADDQAKLSNLQNTLAMDQEKLSQDQSKLNDLKDAMKDPQAFLQKAQDKVNSTKATLDNANQDLANKQATLDQATKTYNDSVDQLNQLKQQLASDQAKLQQLQDLGDKYANADKALQEAQDAYNNAVKALNDAQSQMNADSDTLAKAQQAYIDAQNKLNELETILKNDEKTVTTVDVQWVKHPHTTSEIGNKVVLSSSKQNTSSAVTMPAVNTESSSLSENNTVHADTVSAVKEAQANENDEIYFAASTNDKKAKNDILPQMGEENNDKTVWGEISLAMAGILGMLGLAKRKRHN